MHPKQLLELQVLSVDLSKKKPKIMFKINLTKVSTEGHTFIKLKTISTIT